MAQAPGGDAKPSVKPSAQKQQSYAILEDNDEYEKYRGNCGRTFSQSVTKAGGYRKWFNETFKTYKDNVWDVDKKLTFGVTFGGLMKDHLKFPKMYTYDYDIILRIVRGEKRFIAGYLSSQEYVYNLYIRASVENQNLIVSKFLKQFGIISEKSDASIYRDKRRSLSLGVASPSNEANVSLLVDRTSKDKKNEQNKDDVKEDKKDVGKKEEMEESKYEHRVCNAHEEATDAKLKDASCLSDIKKRVGDKYSVRVVQGIPNFAQMKESDESDIIVSFVKDDLFRFQATYLKKSTFKDDAKEKKRVYDALYKWPKSAKEIFGQDNIPQRNTKGLLSVFTTVSTTKVDIKQSD